MLSKAIYYSEEPIMEKVSEQEFINFIEKYPRKLVKNVSGICDPPSITYNDFELADRWPYSIVANTWMYSDNPEDYFYEPEEKREYIIMTNYEEVFNSRTGINTSEYEKQLKKSEKNYCLKEITEAKFIDSNSNDILFTLEVKDCSLETNY